MKISAMVVGEFELLVASHARKSNHGEQSKEAEQKIDEVGAAVSKSSLEKRSAASRQHGFESP